MNNTVVFPQLNSENFNHWKFRVKALLEEKQISIVLEKEVADYAEENEKEEFKKKDAKAKSIIIQCVTDKHLDIIKDSLTARKMVKSLEDVFQRKSIFSKLTLKKKLLTMKCGKNEKLEDHFQKFDMLIRELECVGSKIEETDKVCHLLLTLNEEYEAVITAIETLNTDVTMEFVKSRLLDEELKIRTRNTKPGVNSNEVSFKAGQFTCYRCGKPGHKSVDCFSGKQDKQFRGRGNRGSKGNFRGRRGTNLQANEASSSDSQIAFFVSNSVKSVNDINAFILDSGATEHLITDKLIEHMVNVVDLDREIKIGTAKCNDVLIARKRGTIIGKCQGKEIKIEALIVNGMSHNLISVSRLLDKNFNIKFKKKQF